MAIDVNVSVRETSSNEEITKLTKTCDELRESLRNLQSRHEELVRQMGNHISPFPEKGVDGFLSHFVMQIRFRRGAMAGKVVTLAMPPATQTVARSEPFIYQGRSHGHVAKIPLPKGCTLSDTISEEDFISRPQGYFTPGAQVVWMQILNLDAQMKTEWGPIRIILGETLKREYGDIFQPSLGVAEALGSAGFPARLFFNPYAVVETPFGVFRAIHGTLSYGRVTSFPPVGTPVSICECIPLEDVSEVRARNAKKAGLVEPFAEILALMHPIDTPLQLPGDDAFQLVEDLVLVGRDTSEKA